MTTSTKMIADQAVASPAAKPNPSFEPAADVIEKLDSVLVILDLPGVDHKGLEVTIEDHLLTVRGKSAVAETQHVSAAHREFEPYDYARSFRIGADIDESRIAANIKNGVLRLTLPKLEAARPRQISVKTE